MVTGTTAAKTVAETKEQKYPVATLVVAAFAMFTGLAAFGIAAYSLYYTMHGQDYPRLQVLGGLDWTCAGYCDTENDSIEILSPTAPLLKLSNGKKDSEPSMGLYDERTGVIEILGSPPSQPGQPPKMGWAGTGHVSHDGKYIIWTSKGTSVNNGTAWVRKAKEKPSTGANG